MLKRFQELPRLPKLIVGGLVLLFLCVICSLLIPSEPGPSEEEIVATWFAETQTAAALLPTATIPSSETPSPSATSTVSHGEAYLTQVGVYALVIQYDMEVFQELTTQASENPYILLTESWQTESDNNLADLVAHSNELAALEAPPEFAEIHALLTNFANEIEIMAALYEEGADTINADLIIEANTHLGLATDYLEQATELMTMLQTQTP